MSAPPAKKSKADAKSLRIGWGPMLTHAIVYLTRCGVLASLAAVLIVQPLFFNVYLKLPFIRTLSEPALFIVTFAWVCHALPYMIFNGFYLFMDSLNPEVGGSSLKNLAPFAALGRYFSQFKLPRRTSQWPSPQLTWRTILKGLAEQYLIIPTALSVFLYTLGHAQDLPSHMRYISGFSPADQALYTSSTKGFQECLVAFAKLVPHFMISNLLNEVLFFIAHGALHSNATLYRLFHKKHHEYTGTISVAAEYATPLEELLANTMPTVLYFSYAFFKFSDQTAKEAGLYVEAARVWPMFITWMWARLWETYETHSGYCFSDTFLGRCGLLHGYRARFHDYHHTHNVGNYGAGIGMDMLCNTMDSYNVFEYNRTLSEGEAAEKKETKKPVKTD